MCIFLIYKLDIVNFYFKILLHSISEKQKKRRCMKTGVFKIISNNQNLCKAETPSGSEASKPHSHKPDKQHKPKPKPGHSHKPNFKPSDSHRPKPKPGRPQKSKPDRPQKPKPDRPHKPKPKPGHPHMPDLNKPTHSHRPKPKPGRPQKPKPDRPQKPKPDRPHKPKPKPGHLDKPNLNKPTHSHRPKPKPGRPQKPKPDSPKKPKPDSPKKPKPDRPHRPNPKPGHPHKPNPKPTHSHRPKPKPGHLQKPKPDSSHSPKPAPDFQQEISKHQGNLGILPGSNQGLLISGTTGHGGFQAVSNPITSVISENTGTQEHANSGKIPIPGPIDLESKIPTGVFISNTQDHISGSLSSQAASGAIETGSSIASISEHIHGDSFVIPSMPTQTQGISSASEAVTIQEPIVSSTIIHAPDSNSYGQGELLPLGSVITTQSGVNNFGQLILPKPTDQEQGTSSGTETVLFQGQAISGPFLVTGSSSHVQETSSNGGTALNQVLAVPGEFFKPDQPVGGSTPVVTGTIQGEGVSGTYFIHGPTSQGHSISTGPGTSSNYEHVTHGLPNYQIESIATGSISHGQSSSVGPEIINVDGQAISGQIFTPVSPDKEPGSLSVNGILTMQEQTNLGSFQIPHLTNQQHIVISGSGNTANNAQSGSASSVIHESANQQVGGSSMFETDSVQVGEVNEPFMVPVSAINKQDGQSVPGSLFVQGSTEQQQNSFSGDGIIVIQGQAITDPSQTTDEIHSFISGTDTMTNIQETISDSYYMHESTDQRIVSYFDSGAEGYKEKISDEPIHASMLTIQNQEPISGSQPVSIDGQVIHRPTQVTGPTHLEESESSISEELIGNEKTITWVMKEEQQAPHAYGQIETENRTKSGSFLEPILDGKIQMTGIFSEEMLEQEQSASNISGSFNNYGPTDFYETGIVDKIQEFMIPDYPLLDEAYEMDDYFLSDEEPMGMPVSFNQEQYFEIQNSSDLTGHWQQNSFMNPNYTSSESEVMNTDYVESMVDSTDNLRHDACSVAGPQPTKYDFMTLNCRNISLCDEHGNLMVIFFS